MDSELERILRDDYLGDVTNLSLETVRSMRDECQAVETELSYLRRLTQARLDIVAAERRRREEGGAPADLASLVAALPSILADRIHAPGLGRLPRLLAPGKALPELEEELDTIVGGHDIESLPDVGDDELAALADALAEFERKVSSRRRELFDRVDTLQAEITRRYRTGEASVESLLG